MEPLLRVRNPGLLLFPFGKAVCSDTSPVGTPLPELGETAMFSVTGLPWVTLIVLGPRVVFVALNATVFHLVTRLLAFTKPRRVARSYPTPAWYFAKIVP